MILPTLLLVSQVTIAVADRVPHLDVATSCRTATKAVVGLGQTMDGCLKSENGARDQLAKEWSSFPAPDRSSCLTLTRTGTTGTYTELLTCLEMKRDARRLPKEPTTGLPHEPSTVGRGM
jgi:hypothetical protein